MENHPFGKVVYAYTRSQAVADGFQIEVTKTAEEAGIRFPVFITRTAFDAYVTVPPDVAGQDEAGRLWDVVWMLRFAIRKAQTGQTRLPFALYVRNDNRAPRLIKLVAIPTDKSKAVALLKRAAAAGHKQAAQLLRQLR